LIHDQVQEFVDFLENIC